MTLFSFLKDTKIVWHSSFNKDMESADNHPNV